MGISFSEEFFKEETRRGFTISEVMKRAWAADIMVFDDIRNICRENSLKIFACYGSLLGTIRERGFIPWDDDIDLGLVGEDYIKLLDILGNYYSGKYNILNPYTKSWYCMNFTHIANSRETSFKREYLKKWHGCPFMRGLDIYPYYYIPRDPNEEKFILEILRKIDTAIAVNKKIEAGEVNLNESLAIALVELQHETGYSFSTDRPLSNQLEILYDQVCRITEEKDAEYLARYDEYTVDRTKKFPKELFINTIDYPFENTSMPVIIGYDRMLKARFGDSYIVPRQEKGLHDYPYYRKQLFDDSYHKEELKFIDECDIPDADLTKKAGQTVILYHTSVKEMLINCDKAIDKIKKTIDLFDECRDDIVFVWLPDIFLKNDEMAMDMVAPKLVTQYEEILKKYIENKGITFRIDKTDNDILSLCDLYYGDEGIYADLFRQNNKEVIIQDYSVSGVQIAERFGIAEEKAQKEEFNEKENREDQIKPEPDIQEEWKKAIYKEDGNPKKVLLYYTSISVLYEYRDFILEKIRKVLDSLRNENNNIFLIWRPEPLADDLRSVFDKDFLNDYEALMEGFEAEGWGIIDKSSDDSAALKAADALYGDSDALILKAIEMGKPVMLQNPQL